MGLVISTRHTHHHGRAFGLCLAYCTEYKQFSGIHTSTHSRTPITQHKFFRAAGLSGCIIMQGSVYWRVERIYVCALDIARKGLRAWHTLAGGIRWKERERLAMFTHCRLCIIHHVLFINRFIEQLIDRLLKTQRNPSRPTYSNVPKSETSTQCTSNKTWKHSNHLPTLLLRPIQAKIKP